MQPAFAAADDGAELQVFAAERCAAEELAYRARLMPLHYCQAEAGWQADEITSRQRLHFNAESVILPTE